MTSDPQVLDQFILNLEPRRKRTDSNLMTVLLLPSWPPRYYGDQGLHPVIPLPPQAQTRVSLPVVAAESGNSLDRLDQYIHGLKNNALVKMLTGR